MPESSIRPKRPYLLRAMHQWMTDSGHTPHIIVDIERSGVEVPRAYAKDGKIVLNVSFNAAQRLHLGDEWVELDARFSGVSQHVRFPVSAVLGIYARETGEGMVFSEHDMGPDSPSPRPTNAPEEGGRGRPQLKVVK